MGSEMKFGLFEVVFFLLCFIGLLVGYPFTSYAAS